MVIIIIEWLRERTKQLDIFCHVTGYTSDFLSFIVVELIRFFYGALHLEIFRELNRLRFSFVRLHTTILKCHSQKNDFDL